MKILSLILWVGQFGFSVIFPTLVFLLLGNWLQTRFSLGFWVLAVCGIVGVLTSVSTARSCLKALRKAAEEAGSGKTPPTSFSDHA